MLVSAQVRVCVLHVLVGAQCAMQMFMLDTPQDG
jgi:hypothetical protein